MLEQVVKTCYMGVDTDAARFIGAEASHIEGEEVKVCGALKVGLERDAFACREEKKTYVYLRGFLSCFV